MPSNNETEGQTGKDNPDSPLDSTTLYRSTSNRILGGVAGGFGEYFGVDPSIIRIIFVLLTIFGGSGVLIYLILWVILPSQNSVSPEHIHHNIQEVRQKAAHFAHYLGRDSDYPHTNYWLGVVILILGTIFLLNNLGLTIGLSLGRFWPLVLIVIGLAIFTRKKS
jgi:phage shock protein C